MAGKAAHKIEIDSYYDKVHQATWARRTAGFIGGTALGALAGGIIGAMMAVVPFLLGAAGVAGAAAVGFPGLLAIASSAALFAGLGGSMGFVAVGVAGANAGAVAAGMEEKERREKLEKFHGPSQGHSHADPEVQVNEHPLKTPAKLFNWKVAAVTIPAVAAFGAILSMNPAIAPAIMSQSGFAAGSWAAAAYGGAAMGMFGGLFSFKFSHLTNKFSNVAYKVVTGKLFEDAPAPEPVREMQQEITVSKIISGDMPVISEHTREARQFSRNMKQDYLNNIVEKTEECGPELVRR